MLPSCNRLFGFLPVPALSQISIDPPFCYSQSHIPFTAQSGARKCRVLYSPYSVCAADALTCVITAATGLLCRDAHVRATSGADVHHQAADAAPASCRLCLTACNLRHFDESITCSGGAR